MQRKPHVGLGKQHTVEILESRDLMTIAINPSQSIPELPIADLPSIELPIDAAEVRSIQLREDASTGIEFDDTRVGDVYITNGSGVERFINITQRADGRQEFGLVGLASLFDVLPAKNEGLSIEIVSASLTLSSNWDAGIGSKVSVAPIDSEWLSLAAGRNESQPSLNSAGTWMAGQFGPDDFSKSNGTTVVWTAGKNVIDVTTALQSMYVAERNQGFVIAAENGPNGQRADLLISTSEHWIPDERPTLDISYRYVSHSADPTEPNPTQPDPEPDLEPDLEQPGDPQSDSPEPFVDLPIGTGILHAEVPNTANDDFLLTRYYAESLDDHLLSHSQSGELTGFSPDGKWHHMLVGFENWFLRNVETGEIRFAHKTTAGQSGNNSFQWTERNNYLRFAAAGVLEEVDPATRNVVHRANLTTATLSEEDLARVDYQQFRLGESSGSDGIYVVQLVSLDEAAEQERFINVIDTSNGQFEEKYFYAFDENVHNNNATSNRWRELYFTNDTFNVHLSPFGREGTGKNNVGGNAYYNFPANGDGEQWELVSLTSDIPDTVGSDAQSHRTLETIDGTVYVAYSTWRGSFNYVIVAEQVSGREVAKVQMPSQEFVVHLQFYKNEIVYSVEKVLAEGLARESLRVESFVVDVKSGSVSTPRVIADVKAQVDKFETSVRPFTDATGSYCWHTNEYSGGRTVDIVCATPRPVGDNSPQQPSVTPDSKSTDLLFAAFLSLSRQFDLQSDTEGGMLAIIQEIGALRRSVV